MPDPAPMRDLCFVAMPFGTKTDVAGPVAFDAVYRSIIEPAIELAVLANHRENATESIGNALIAMREKWEGESTARNLRLIAETRQRRGEDVGWIEELVTALLG